MKNKRVEISFQSHEIWKVSSADKTLVIICPVCGTNQPVISDENSIPETPVKEHKFCQKTEYAEIHLSEIEREKAKFLINETNRFFGYSIVNFVVNIGKKILNKILKKIKGVK